MAYVTAWLLSQGRSKAERLVLQLPMLQSPHSAAKHLHPSSRHIHWAVGSTHHVCATSTISSMDSQLLKKAPADSLRPPKKYRMMMKIDGYSTCVMSSTHHTYDMSNCTHGLAALVSVCVLVQVCLDSMHQHVSADTVVMRTLDKRCEMSHIMRCPLNPYRRYDRQLGT